MYVYIYIYIQRERERERLGYGPDDRISVCGKAVMSIIHAVARGTAVRVHLSGGSYPAAKAAGREADNPPPSSAKTKNARSRTSPPHLFMQ
jgi:hypothetical protein